MAPLSKLVLSVLLAILPAAISAAALAAGPVVGPDIFGGTVTKLGEFPFIITTILLGRRAWCGGVLLNANTVLTVAHCSKKFENATASWFNVRAGSLERDSGGTVVNVTEILYYPGFEYNTGGVGLALYHLAAPIHENATICYAKLSPKGSTPSPGTNVTTAGWGATNATDDYKYGSPYLLEVTGTVIDPETCRARYETIGIDITDDVFCAGTGQDGKGACHGDSGGPVIDTESRVVLGLNSISTGICGHRDDYDLDVRLGKFIDWIDENKW